MQADSLKATFTYTIALVVILGGFIFLFFSRLDPPSQIASLQLAIVGFIGAALTFVFQQETQTRTARQVERSYANAQPQIQATSGPPAGVTVTPQEPVADNT